MAAVQSQPKTHTKPPTVGDKPGSEGKRRRRRRQRKPAMVPVTAVTQAEVGGLLTRGLAQYDKCHIAKAMSIQGASTECPDKSGGNHSANSGHVTAMPCDWCNIKAFPRVRRVSAEDSFGNTFHVFCSERCHLWYAIREENSGREGSCANCFRVVPFHKEPRKGGGSFDMKTVVNGHLQVEKLFFCSGECRFTYDIEHCVSDSSDSDWDAA